MLRFLRALAAVIGIATLPAAGLAQDTLYERLGGYRAIAALADDFVKRLARDSLFDRFFADATDGSTEELRWMIVDFMCEETGGPCIYTGRDMKAAHEGIGVTKEEWDRAIALFGESMSAQRVPAQEAQDLATLIVPLESDIVEQ